MNVLPHLRRKIFAHAGTVLACLLIVSCATRNKSKTDNHLHTGNNDTTSCLPRYAGFIDRFDSDGSLYTDVYLRDEFGYDDFEKVASLADSTIYEDTEIRRKRIPMEIAKKYLNLTGLDSIDVFSATGDLINKAYFSHIEHFDYSIGSNFVAVFDVAKRNDGKAKICITSTTASVKSYSYAEIQDKDLTLDAAKYVDINPSDVSEARHWEHEGTRYSVVSSGPASYIVVSDKNRLSMLYTTKKEETISDIAFTPIIINSRPVLVVKYGLLETDITWSGLLVFDGGVYKPNYDMWIGCPK